MRLIQTNTGSSSSETTVSRQSSASIATIVAITVVRLETSEVAVEVTVACMPPMSLAMRDCTSPVRVRVKNASDMRCRWRVDGGAQVVHDALADGGGDQGLQDAEDAGDDRDQRSCRARAGVSRPVRPCGIAMSRIARSRNGEATETSDDSGDEHADDGQPAAVGAEESTMRRNGARGSSWPK